MKIRLFATLGDGIAKTAALTLICASLAAPVFAQTRHLKVFPAISASSGNITLPKGTRMVGRIPLNGEPVTRMYTQSEYGRTYLYLVQGHESLITVDVTKKRNPQLVSHEPLKVEPARYEQLFEGGSIQVSPYWQVNAGIDNLGWRGMYSVLESSNPDDAKLLEALGPSYSNLADRDRRLVYFASPSQLLVVQDNRLTAIDFITN